MMSSDFHHLPRVKPKCSNDRVQLTIMIPVKGVPGSEPDT